MKTFILSYIITLRTHEAITTLEWVVLQLWMKNNIDVLGTDICNRENHC